jgi:hypothetical protein
MLSSMLLMPLLALHATSEPSVEGHVMVYQETGRFGGWPANHGVWIWGDEILVGFSRGYYKDLGPTRHHIDRERPEEHWFARSLDGGKSWSLNWPSEKGQLIPQGEALHGTETPGLIAPPLVPCPGGIDFEHPDFAMTLRMFNKEVGVSSVFYSHDRGRNWKGPFELPALAAPGYMARTSYMVEGKAQCSLFLSANDEEDQGARIFCARSYDGGTTWNFLSWIGPAPEGFVIMPAAARFSPTELYVTARRRDGERRWISAYRSTDDGHTWLYESDPVDNTGEGNPPSMILLRDGRLALVYGVREKPFRIAAKLSDDRGRTWSPEIVLRDDGANRDIGYVRSVQRSDGKIVSIYYSNDVATGPERYIAATIWDPGAVAQ